MTAQEWLNELSTCCRDIRLMERRLEAMRLGRWGSEPGRRGVGGTSDKVCDAACEIASIEAMARRDQRELAARMEEGRQVLRTMGELDSRLHSWVLELRYMEGLQWKQVAEVVSLSESKTYQLHREATSWMDGYGLDALRAEARRRMEEKGGTWSHV